MEIWQIKKASRIRTPFFHSSVTNWSLATPGASATAGEEAAHLLQAHRTINLQLLLTALWAGFILYIKVGLGSSRIITSTFLTNTFVVGHLYFLLFTVVALFIDYNNFLSKYQPKLLLQLTLFVSGGAG
jgi:hypothetical protein